MTVAIAAWLASSAQGATWVYRAPVPVTAPADGSGFSVCLKLPATIDVAPARVSEGSLSLTCRPEETHTSLCYDVGEPWPEAFPALSCAGPRTKVQIRFVPAFLPEDDVLDGVVIASGIDEVAASFALPEGSWPDQTYEGARDTVCRVREERLWIWRDGPGRRKSECELRERDGTVHRFPVRFKGRVAAGRK